MRRDTVDVGVWVVALISTFFPWITASDATVIAQATPWGLFYNGDFQTADVNHPQVMMWLGGAAIMVMGLALWLGSTALHHLRFTALPLFLAGTAGMCAGMWSFLEAEVGNVRLSIGFFIGATAFIAAALRIIPAFARWPDTDRR